MGATVYLVVNMSLSWLARRLNRGPARPNGGTGSTALNDAQIAQNTSGGQGTAV